VVARGSVCRRDELVRLSAANSSRVRPSVRHPRETRRSTTDPALCNTHLARLLGFEDMILLRTGGLAASPPVRYTLETEEQCPSRRSPGKSAIAQRLLPILVYRHQLKPMIQTGATLMINSSGRVQTSLVTIAQGNPGV
jgi:hypothetical protein